jgi:nucleoside-diphosphate-sugar epimerase
VVAVTNAGGPAGRAVVDALVLRMSEAGSGLRPKRVLAICSAENIGEHGQDAVEPAAGAHLDDHKDLHRQSCDIASPEVAQVLAGADVVIHLACADDLAGVLGEPLQARRLRAVRAAQAVSMAAAAVGAQRLIAVTSAMVFGARLDNPIPLPDDCTARADPDDGLIGDLLEVERVLERIPRVHPGLAFTLLRPAALVGPGVDSALTRHFEAPRLLVLRGTSTRWQFCHLQDLASAVCAAITAGLDGALTAASTGSLSEEDVEQRSGMRRIEVPAGLAFSTAERLHRVGVLSTPAGELAYVVHPWVVDSQRLRAAGWQPEHHNETCLDELMDSIRNRRAGSSRRVDRREAAMGAAGAAVALLGTAAVLRQARSRQTKRRRSTLDP